MDEIIMRWYGVYPTSAFDMSKTYDSLKTLTADEPSAQIERESVYPRIYVRTALTWEFLRESFPYCVVSLADRRNKGI